MLITFKQLKSLLDVYGLKIVDWPRLSDEGEVIGGSLRFQFVGVTSLFRDETLIGELLLSPDYHTRQQANLSTSRPFTVVVQQDDAEASSHSFGRPRTRLVTRTGICSARCGSASSSLMWLTSRS